jgi:hypothetical protein
MDGTPPRQSVPGDVALAGPPHDPMGRMRKGATGAVEDTTFAKRRVGQEIGEMPVGYVRRIEDAAYVEALALLRAIRAKGAEQIVTDTPTTGV